ncbi:MAG: Ig-like domain-containing protein [Pseudomonadota bacterium]
MRFFPLALCLAACAPGFPEPSLTGIEPRVGYNGEPTAVHLTGVNFFPAVEIDVREQGARLDRQFEVTLYGNTGEFALEGVEPESYGDLWATVPEGLPIGQYGVRLVTPTGEQTRLPHGFRVTDTRADHLAFTMDAVVFDVNSPFTVDFSLLDPEGSLVQQTLDVRLAMSADDGVAELQLGTDGLAHPVVEPIEGGVMVTGTLRASGHGYVTVESATPETIALSLDPREDDSVVAGASSLIAIEAGQLREVRIDLPGGHEPFEATAGVAFPVTLSLVDEWGNVLDDALATLDIKENGNVSVASVEIEGQATVDIAVTVATDEETPENFLSATGTTSGQSTGFTVLPGEAARYEVDVYPSRVTAGSSTLYTTVYAVDTWGNALSDYGEDWEQVTGAPLQLSLSDTLGGLDPDVGYGVQVCPGFNEGFQICEVRVWTAGIDDQVLVLGEDGLLGRSPKFDVSTGPLAQIILDVAAGPFTAGTAFNVTVQPLDAYLNAIAINPTTTTVSLEGDPGALECAWDGVVNPDGRRTFACTATLATDSETITASIPSLATVAATSDDFRVENGPLGEVVFDLAAGSAWVAGQTFGFGLQGYDAWGNPYIVQADPVVQLEDATGSLVAADVTLDSSGAGIGTGSITTASAADRISASQYGVVLGSSEAFAITAAALDALEVAPAAGWVFLGEPLSVSVTAVDTYSNPVLDFDEEVVLWTHGGSVEDSSLLDWENGVCQVELVFDTAQVGETISASATASGVEGSFTPLDVLEAGCGVSATLLVDGTTEPVLCLATGGVTVDIDAGASSGATLFRIEDDLDLAQRGLRDSATVTWEDAGPRRVTLVAFDADGCGDSAEALAWLAEPDGSPAGPVSIQPVSPSCTVGSSSAGSTLVDVQAYDCALDVARYGVLLVRADLGDLTTGLTASGEGLEIALDAVGHGQFTWSVASALHGGTATLYTGRADGIALGTTTVLAEGDDALPFVLEVDPAGAVTGSQDTFTVRFSEPMRAALFTVSSVTLDDGAGPLAFDSLALDDTGTVLTIALSEPVDLGAAATTLTLSSQIRDIAGNRLDGAWTGAAASFSLTLGAVTDTAPDIIGCVADTEVVRPDGDDVPGTAEADEAYLDVTADAAPHWWRMVVEDEAGVERLVRWTGATGAADTLTWFGRDQAGLILPNGVYSLEVRAADAYLDLGAGCTVEVTLDNVVVEVP